MSRTSGPVGESDLLTVIIDAVDQAGITAWKTRGTDLRDYLEGNLEENDES
jgi:hypothetical protein